jgi:alpha-ribazole phosphatase
MRLVLARHGATDHNIERRYTGQTDAPLSPLGLRQAAALAARLAGERFDLILCSDLARARQTAAPIARRLDAPLRFDPDLREIAMGRWEGQTHAELAAADPEALAAWQTDPEGHAPPGGETTLQLRDRTVRALDRCRSDHPDGAVLWITHGGVIGVLLCHLLRIGLEHRWRFRRDNAALTEADVAADYAILMRLNDTCHLADLPAAEREQVL